ncbi:MAG: Sensory box histidine kinase [Labilithrix sp.]|nr:Sensory box histidine kinase [Labilithrix sp.]
MTNTSSMANTSSRNAPACAIPLTLEPTDVLALLRASLVPLAAQAASERIELRVVSLGSIPTVAVDREKIAWCVATLVGNALRYVRRSDGAGEMGGSVLVHVEHDEGSTGVAIAVHDDGPGIPDDKLPYLFERRRGSMHVEGLALSLVRQIVSAHGGEILVESRRGRDEHGTSVTIQLRG